MGGVPQMVVPPKWSRPENTLINWIYEKDRSTNLQRLIAFKIPVDFFNINLGRETDGWRLERLIHSPHPRLPVRGNPSLSWSRWNLKAKSTKGQIL